MTQLLNSKEVASRLAVKPATIRKWCRSGTVDLGAVRIGKTIRFNADRIEALASGGAS